MSRNKKILHLDPIPLQLELCRIKGDLAIYLNAQLDPVKHYLLTVQKVIDLTPFFSKCASVLVERRNLQKSGVRNQKWLLIEL